MTDGTDKPATEARALIVSGNRQSYLIQRVLGWLLLIPSVIVFLVTALMGLLTLAAGILTALVPDLDGLSDVPVLAFGVPFLASGILGLVGYGALREVRELVRLRLRIDEHGITREGEPPLSLPWDRIRHLAVTRHRPGARRLIVDDGTGPELTPSDASGSLRAEFSRREYALDVPVDRLDVDAERLVQAIRHYSGQRLPDL